MRWDQDHESPDLIDRRGERGGGGGGIGGLLWLLPWLLRTPFGWVILLGILAYVVLGGIGRAIFGGAAQDTNRARSGEVQSTPANDPDAKLVHFVSFVLDDVQATWEREFAAEGRSYRHAKLVLFTDETSTGCGYGQAATGPFYCPQDERVYIDLGFYRELAGKLGARGQFAEAYVIAHEIGHHVQNLLGIEQRVHQLRHTEGASGASVRLELQADCFAGIWAHSTAQRNLLEAGDVDSALNAAAAIGDDRLQRMATGTVSPEKWTHGSSAERVRWFRTGYDRGQIAACDTFAAPAL